MLSGLLAIGWNGFIGTWQRDCKLMIFPHYLRSMLALQGWSPWQHQLQLYVTTHDIQHSWLNLQLAWYISIHCLIILVLCYINYCRVIFSHISYFVFQFCVSTRIYTSQWRYLENPYTERSLWVNLLPWYSCLLYSSTPALSLGSCLLCLLLFVCNLGLGGSTALVYLNTLCQSTISLLEHVAQCSYNSVAKYFFYFLNVNE